MLLNIGSNAAKFTERGSVTLTAKLLDAPTGDASTLAATGDATLAAEGRVSVLLTCVDTGIGIPPGDISRVFERYSKVECDDDGQPEHGEMGGKTVKMFFNQILFKADRFKHLSAPIALNGGNAHF